MCGWAASCLTYSPHILLLCFQNTKISAGERSGPFQSQNTCLASISKVLFYYFQTQLNWNDKYFEKRNMNPLTQTHTLTHKHKHKHTHTHTHTRTQTLLQIMERTLHCLNFTPISLCYVCYVMYYQCIFYNNQLQLTQGLITFLWLFSFLILNW